MAGRCTGCERTTERVFEAGEGQGRKNYCVDCIRELMKKAVGR
jgi:hypothetical protein